MRIAIDARLNAYRQGGIPQYTRQLLTALAEVARDDQIISLQHRDQLRPLAIAPNVVRRTALTPPHHRFEQWTLPLEVLLARPNVLHCPDFIAPVRRPCPAVVTIHDLAFLHYPEILDAAGSAYYGQIKTNAHRADAIIAVSEATRQDIAQFLDIPIEQIDVIHEAAAPLYSRLSLRPGEARVLQATPVAADTFLLFVSTLEPRKNLPTLLQALRICIDRQPQAGYRLVVVGARGWKDETIFATVRDLRLADHVFFAGAVGQYDLRWLYNACRLYINPSLYEGFGLPLLEAMACGAACLAAATSSMPEIGGSAAIYIPPLDPGLWADAIEELWNDEERRAALGRLGRVQAQRFSWMRAARETLNVYRRVVEQAATRAVPVSAREPVRQLSLPEIDLPALAEPAAAPSPGEPRACLRCGVGLLAGQIQHRLAVQQPDTTANGSVLAPRAWACPRCGHVELVVDWVEAQATEAADTATHPTAPMMPAESHPADTDAPRSTAESSEMPPVTALNDPTPSPVDVGAADSPPETLFAEADDASGAAPLDPPEVEASASPAPEDQSLHKVAHGEAANSGETPDELALGAQRLSHDSSPETCDDSATQIYEDSPLRHDAGADDHLNAPAKPADDIDQPLNNGRASARLDNAATSHPPAEATDVAPLEAPEPSEVSGPPRTKRRQSRSKRKPPS